jgi:chorismate mutase / prephenate dehydrogenase
LKTLEELRAQIDTCDKILIEALSNRLTLVREVAKQKQTDALGVFDRNREREVLERAITRGQALGVTPLQVERFAQTLFELSHDIQEEECETAKEKKSILIVGGAGRMGRRFGSEFAKRGHDVRVLERGEVVNPALCRNVDCIMLAVPMSEVSSVARTVAPHLSEKALLLDINSLKQDICSVMAEVHSGEVLGTHPMFGPTVKSFRRQKVILCPMRRGPLTQWITAELGALGLDLVETDPATHDRIMARVQVLTHFSKIVLAQAWQKGGCSVEETLNFVSPIYRLELAVVSRLFAQDPALYAEIEMENLWGSEVRKDLLAATQELHALIERGDRQAFADLFLELRAYLRGFSEEAMQLSDRLVDDLTRRA